MLSLLWIGCNRPGPGDQTLGVGPGHPAGGLVVGVLAVPFQGTSQVGAEKSRTGVEQMGWSNFEMTVKRRRMKSDQRRVYEARCGGD